MANIITSFPDDKKAKTLIGSSPVVLNVSKKILARQSIFRNIDCNITHNIKRGPSFLTEEQIKMSSIYQKLIQRIQKAKLREEEEIRQHQKAMERMAGQIKYLKTSVQEDKVEMWEVKNEIMELEEVLQQQMEEYNAICEEMRAEEGEDDQQQQQQQFQGQQGQQDNQQGQYQNESNSQSQTSSTSYQLQTNKSQQQVSKPSCSIKYFISNRTITSPGLSKENLQVGLGINFNSHKDNGSSGRNYQQQFFQVEKEGKQPLSENYLLAFKKSEKLVCEEG